MLDSMSRRSRVEVESCVRAMSGCGDDCGRSSRVEVMRGRRVEMVSASGRMARGPEKEAVSEVRVRDWWVKWVVRAS